MDVCSKSSLTSVHKSMRTSEMLGLLPKCPRLVVHSTFPVNLSISPAHERSRLITSVEPGGSPFGADLNNPVSLTP